MSDIHTDNNEITHLRATVARLESMVATLHSGAQQDNPFIADQKPFQELTPNEELLELIPAMSGKNFFKRPKPDETHNLDLDFPRYPKNTMQSYTAPLVSALPWPTNAGDDQKVDKLLAKYQEYCALLTKPLDTYAASTLGSNKWDDDHKESVRQFVQLFRSHIADLSHKIADDRYERFLHAKELRPTANEGKEILISSEEMADHVKETQLARSASTKPKGSQYNSSQGKPHRGRGGYHNGRGAFNNWNSPQQYLQQQQPQQQQYQQQQYYQQQQQGPTHSGYGQNYGDYSGSSNGHQGSSYFPRGSRGRGRGKPQNNQ